VVKAMNYGEKITKLKDSTIYKHWTKYGEAIGVSGEWLAEQAKKEMAQTADIPRLIRIVEYHQVSLDYLLRNDEGNYTIDKVSGLSDNDIGKMIDNIQEQIKSNEIKFYGYSMNKECVALTEDALEVLKGLIKSNL
jgi:hypothetical protein